MLAAESRLELTIRKKVSDGGGGGLFQREAPSKTKLRIRVPAPRKTCAGRGVYIFSSLGTQKEGCVSCLARKGDYKEGKSLAEFHQRRTGPIMHHVVGSEERSSRGSEYISGSSSG